MPNQGGAYWLHHCAPPRQRPPGIEWDVFISYRSADRIWALALYDMLQQASYKVFLDQFVLTAGSSLLGQLSDNISRSASGVILWSERALDSEWVEREIGAMVHRKDDTKRSPFPFHFVAACLDQRPLPALLSGSLFIDFSSYPDGPTGAELVRLTSGLQGASLNPDSIKHMIQFESAVLDEPANLRAMVVAKEFDAIAVRAQEDTPPYTTSATLPAFAAQLLISGKHYDNALTVLDGAQLRFPRSIRIAQLRGLALRRSGRTLDALRELEKLRQKGHQDPETLGMLGAVWTDLWRRSGNRDELERARDIYADAFQLTPTDTYVGINAATKSALLGDMNRAKNDAALVLKLLSERATSNATSTDYWERVTQPEALFLLEQFDTSLKLYHSARIAHQTEIGSLESTAAQLSLLIALPFVPELWREKFRQEFAPYWPKQS